MLLLFLALLGSSGLEPSFIAHSDFYKPTNVRVDSTGRIYVVDGGAHVVWRFNADGTLIDGVGHEGQGPGEFQNPSDVGFLADGRFLVADSGNRRIHLFDSKGSFLKVVSILDQTVGQLLVLPDDTFVLAGTNMNGSFTFSLDAKETNRFGVFNLEGKKVGSIGTQLPQENPMLSTMLNNGYLALMGKTLVYAGLVQNELTFYTDGKEKTGTFPLRFEHVTPSASMAETKNSDGTSSFGFKVEANLLCSGLEVLNERELLLIRARNNEKEVIWELAKIGVDGLPIEIYPHQFNGHHLALSPDKSYVYFLNELDEDMTVARLKL